MKTILVDITVDDSTIDSGNVFDVLEPVWWTANIYDDYHAYKQSIAQFSVEQRFAHAIMWYDAEVSNGGHEQFYANSTGIVWQNALMGFDAIKHQQAFDILNESVMRFGGSPDFDRESRYQQMITNSLEFEDLDERFYELEIFTDLKNYIFKNRHSFYFTGRVEKYVAQE